MNTLCLLIALLLAQASQPELPWRAPPDAPGPPRNLPDIAAEVVVELASSPAAPALGSPEGWSHSHFLDLAADWPDPHLRRPLIRLAGHSNPAIAAVAGVALTRYADEESIATVAHLRGDLRSTGSATVAEMIRRAEESRSADVPVDGDLPGALRAFRVEPGMSRLDVARAAELLEKDNDREALLGFAWLASRGIVLSTDPLTRQWDRLDEPTRAELLRCCRNRIYVAGHPDLANALWEIFERRATMRTSEQTLGEMLDTLLYLGHTRTFEILNYSLDGATSPPDAALLRALAPGLYYWRDVPVDADRCRAWLHSMDSYLPRKALLESRRLPSSAVRQCVTDYFWTRAHADQDMFGIRDFVRNGFEDPADRNHYARMLEKSLAISVRQLNSYGVRIQSAMLVISLEKLTGETLGPSISHLFAPEQENWLIAMQSEDEPRLLRISAACAQWIQDHAVDKPQESVDAP